MFCGEIRSGANLNRRICKRAKRVAFAKESIADTIARSVESTALGLKTVMGTKGQKGCAEFAARKTRGEKP